MTEVVESESTVDYGKFEGVPTTFHILYPHPEVGVKGLALCGETFKVSTLSPMRTDDNVCSSCGEHATALLGEMADWIESAEKVLRRVSDATFALAEMTSEQMPIFFEVRADADAYAIEQANIAAEKAGRKAEKKAFKKAVKKAAAKQSKKTD